MKYLIFGAAGFIGTNLILDLIKNKSIELVVVDQKREFFSHFPSAILDRVSVKIEAYSVDMDFDELFEGIDVVYHLVSTSIPANSNQQITQDLMSNVIFTSNMLEACVRQQVKKVVFLSSGGTVYGKETNCPINEDVPTYPISSYGIQKVTIEKLLYLYHHMYGLDYRVIRLANPYGPYQRPNGVLGAVTTFTYKAISNQTIEIYGDGSVVRDFIYIDDAIRAIRNIESDEAKYKTYNVGSGQGVSILQLVETIDSLMEKDVPVVFKSGRTVDVPVNYLDISRYENEFGKMCNIDIEEGILKTAMFLKNSMDSEECVHNLEKR